jgi:small subunit ribosomal protein S8
MPSSKIKVALAKLLQAEGYIAGYAVSESVTPVLTIALKYVDKHPVIEFIKRISKPGLRVYRASTQIPKVMGGLGIAVVSTSQGLMTDKQARANNVGGEVLCYVA